MYEHGHGCHDSNCKHIYCNKNEPTGHKICDQRYIYDVDRTKYTSNCRANFFYLSSFQDHGMSN